MLFDQVPRNAVKIGINFYTGIGMNNSIQLAILIKRRLAI